ncbi:MAG: Spy/CpxP family protein refolding chaperone [Ferrovum sp.]|nr:Spy/CpxP family protein refolding chaperone [Ferrovum sp.]NDU86681.1 Spy/CpxP family protein refolding chaperone [Ferrovum sp.]
MAAALGDLVMAASVVGMMIDQGGVGMKKVIGYGVLVFSLLGLGVGQAGAYEYQTAPPPANEPPPSPMTSHGDPVNNAQRHLDEFKQELNLSADQQSAWDRYAADTLTTVRQIRDQTQVASAHSGAQDAPARFDEHIALMRQRLASFEQMDRALKTFYATLTPEQKTIADHHFSQLRH